MLVEVGALGSRHPVRPKLRVIQGNPRVRDVGHFERLVVVAAGDAIELRRRHLRGATTLRREDPGRLTAN
eukprot:SAG31_NODE_1611_length_7748_cov_2.128758_8_plen_70_part_00